MVDQKEHAEREKSILDAAEQLILHYGYDKTTVSDIANEAGISKGAIYLHYDSKDDLVEAMIWRQIWIYTDTMLERIENDKEPWSFVTMYRSAMETISDNPLMMAVARSDDRILGNFLRKRSEKFMAFKRPYQLGLLEQMQKQKVIREDIPADVMAYLFATLSTGFIHVGTLDVGMPQPDTSTVILAMGDMIERFLARDDGGNPEAGKQIMLNLIEAMKAQRDTQKQSQ